MSNLLNANLEDLGEAQESGHCRGYVRHYEGREGARHFSDVQKRQVSHEWNQIGQATSNLRSTRTTRLGPTCNQDRPHRLGAGCG